MLSAELSAARLAEIIEALHAAAPSSEAEQRYAHRLRIQGLVVLIPFSAAHVGEAREAGVYDISRSGIAVVDARPWDAGDQFNLHILRANQRPIEVLCTVRHCRRHEDASLSAYIIGAEYGASWLDALSISMAPMKQKSVLER